RGQPEGIRERQSLSALAGSLWHAGEALLPIWDESDMGRSDEQRSAVLDAEANVRPHLAKDGTLGEALRRLARALEEQMPLVVDVEALRIAALTPQTAWRPDPE